MLRRGASSRSRSSSRSESREREGLETTEGAERKGFECGLRERDGDLQNGHTYRLRRATLALNARAAPRASASGGRATEAWGSTEWGPGPPYAGPTTRRVRSG